MGRMLYKSRTEKGMFKNSVLIIADNVAEYFFRNNKETDKWGIEDYPNLAPAFPNMFIEAKIPDVPNRMVQVLRQQGLTSFGMSFTTEENIDTNNEFIKDSKKLIEEILVAYNRVANKPCKNIMDIPSLFGGGTYLMEMINKAKRIQISLSSFERNIKWKTTTKLYIASEDGISPEIASWQYYTKEDGSLATIDGIPCLFGGANEPKGEPKSIEQWESFIYLCTVFQNISMLALSFIHCKNVTIDEAPQETTSKNLKPKSSHSRKKNKPQNQYHTINIEPMKKVLKTEGHTETSGLKQAVHICRGHFKDYREKGLFGKYKGLYWWDMFVKGSSEKGTIEKDYNIKI